MSGEKKLHVLFEHASGFAVFKIKEFEEESMFLSEVRKIDKLIIIIVIIVNC
jgi:hypothetical protein